MKKEELELTRKNVTPAQFAAYVRHQIRKHGLEIICAEDIDLDYWKRGGDLEFNTKHDGIHEKSVSKPYEMQTYIRNADGTVYNLIMEFIFWDDKTGNGYFYFINTWNDDEPETEAAEEQNQESEAALTVEKLNATTYANIYGVYNEAGQPVGTVELKIAGRDAGKVTCYTLIGKYTRRDIRKAWNAHKRRNR